MKTLAYATALAVTSCRHRRRSSTGLSFASDHHRCAFPAPADRRTCLARILAEPLRAALGQPVIIENVGGAGGNIGVGRVARAAPDGYTLIIGQWSTHVVNAVTYTLPYDVVTDFEPIALLANTRR